MILMQWVYSDIQDFDNVSPSTEIFVYTVLLINDVFVMKTAHKFAAHSKRFHHYACSTY